MVLGGAKVAGKTGAAGSLLAVAGRILAGGAMAFTFLAAQGHEVGTSLVEAGQIGTVRGCLDRARRADAEIVLPVDVVVAVSRAPDVARRIVACGAIPPDRMGLDIGPESAGLFAGRLAPAKTIFWNGPMGVFELAPFAEGTRAAARALAGSGAFTVAGGGGTVAAVRALGFADTAFGYLSAGGGASLEFLQARTLPGLAVLQDP